MNRAVSFQDSLEWERWLTEKEGRSITLSALNSHVARIELRSEKENPQSYGTTISFKSLDYRGIPALLEWAVNEYRDTVVHPEDLELLVP